MNNKEITAVEWFMEKIGEKQSNGFYVWWQAPRW